MTFPTADHVAIAIVTAARLVGENPLEVVGGGGAPMHGISRWRHS